MFKKIFAAIIFVVIITAVTANPASASGWQLWHSEGIGGKLSPRWDFSLDKEFRMDNDMAQLYYHHTDFGLGYKMCDWFKLGANYRQVFEKVNGSWIEESRPHINGTFSWNWGAVKVEDRNRFEFRNIEYKGVATRYRNKLTFNFPGSKNFQPYIADEIFIQKVFNKNRFHVGFKSEIVKNLDANISYMLQSTKVLGHWDSINALTVYLNLKIKF